MLDHAGWAVPPADFENVIAFYTAALAPLGITKQVEFPGRAIGFGPNKMEARFWIASKEDATKTGNMHIAFKATDHAQVQAFHAEALKTGGKCNGEPGLREHIHPSYYAAFVHDPLGYNIEVVDHVPHN